MAIYIAREDFLSPIPTNEDGSFKDGSYFGQLGLDYNDVGNRVLWCFTDMGWLDMASLVADFSYCNDNDIENAFSSIKIQTIIDPILKNTIPLTWNDYIGRNECRDLNCKDKKPNCGDRHI